MLAALATLVFLVTLWTIGVVAVRTLEESGSRMLAALRGHSPLAYSATFVPVAGRASARTRAQRTTRAVPRWRAAA